jgi:hypothetical protein
MRATTARPQVSGSPRAAHPVTLFWERAHRPKESRATVDEPERSVAPEDLWGIPHDAIELDDSGLVSSDLLARWAAIVPESEGSEPDQGTLHLGFDTVPGSPGPDPASGPAPASGTAPASGPAPASAADILPILLASDLESPHPDAPQLDGPPAAGGVGRPSVATVVPGPRPADGGPYTWRVRAAVLTVMGLLVVGLLASRVAPDPGRTSSNAPSSSSSTRTDSPPVVLVTNGPDTCPMYTAPAGGSGKPAPPATGCFFVG